MLWSATAIVQSGRRTLRPAKRRSLERLRAGNLVYQVPIDIEDARPVREPLHDVTVPDLVEQRARPRVGHRVSPLWPGSTRPSHSVAVVSFAGRLRRGDAALLLRARSAMRARLPRPATQIIQLGAPHVAAADHGDLGDHRRVEREHALHAFAVADLANGEVAVQALVGTADAHALKGLGARAFALDHLHGDAHRVARREIGHRTVRGQAGDLLGFVMLDDVHRCGPSVMIPYGAAAGLATGAARVADVRASQRSGRRSRVVRSASAWRQAATAPWWPESRTSGTRRPCHSAGRV